jgi:hypothetical protein
LARSAAFEKDAEARFWLQVKSSSDGCWEFAPNRADPSYRKISVDGRYIYAHRYSWTLHNGEVPEGHDVCHRCDNPKCVRPDHLFIETHRNNMLDAVEKRRIAHGSRVGSSKLVDEDVREMFALRSKGWTCKQISSHIGISEISVNHILNGRNWKHLGLSQPDNIVQLTQARGERMGSAKLSEDQVREIFEMRANGELQRTIAEKFGLSQSHVSTILAGKRWAHVQVT